jgi:hypothetical protein
MKTKAISQILSSIISSAATPTAFAAGHGGGGVGGGGFAGGAHFSGGGFRSAPSFNSGSRFSFSTRPIVGQPVMVHPPANGSTSGANARLNTLSHQRDSVSSIDRRDGGNSRSQGTTRGQQPTESAKNHIFARRDASAHPNWDHHGAHYWHNHWWCWDGVAWIGLDTGFYPWDYFPYYAYDYYPYDYYPGYYAEVEPYYNNDGVSGVTPISDPTVVSVQSKLTQLEYYGGPVDGIYGPATRDAVAKYQTTSNLHVTGNLSPDTLKALGLAAQIG